MKTITLTAGQVARLDNDLTAKIDDLIDATGEALNEAGRAAGKALKAIKDSILYASTCCDATEAFENVDESCEYELGIDCEVCFVNACDVRQFNYQVPGSFFTSTTAPNEYGPVSSITLEPGAIWCSFVFEPETGEYNSTLNTEENRYENIFKWIVKGLTDALNRFMAIIKKRKVILVYTLGGSDRYVHGTPENPATISEATSAITQTANDHTLGFQSKECSPVRRFLGTTPKK